MHIARASFVISSTPVSCRSRLFPSDHTGHNDHAEVTALRCGLQCVDMQSRSSAFSNLRTSSLYRKAISSATRACASERILCARLRQAHETVKVIRATPNVGWPPEPKHPAGCEISCRRRDRAPQSRQRWRSSCRPLGQVALQPHQPRHGGQLAASPPA